MYGELIGPGIQKRINYGDKKRFVFFDIIEDGDWNIPYETYGLLDDYKLESVPVFNEAREFSFDDALNYPPEYKTLLSPDGGSFAEGFVMKPVSKNYYNYFGNKFALKKKSEKFAEKEAKGKTIHEETPMDPRVLELYKEFCKYITENRVLSVFSKEGEIQSIKELGKYIPLVLQDAKEDFLKENEVPLDFDQKMIRNVFNGGHLVADILKKKL